MKDKPMKREKWFFEAQRLFKEYKKQSNHIGECFEQKITTYTLEEKWYLLGQLSECDELVYVKTTVTLMAFKSMPEVYFVDGRGQRTYLKKL